MTYAATREMVRDAVAGCTARHGGGRLSAALRRDLLCHGVDPADATQTRAAFAGAAAALGAIVGAAGISTQAHGALHLLDVLGEIADGADL